MKTVKIILILIFTISIVIPNDKDFKRKSILSIENILIKDEGLQSLSKVDYEVINSLIDYNIKVDRYKYDTIPSDMEAEFKTNSGNLQELSPNNLSDLFIDVVNSKITSILNDQDVKQLRLSHLNDEFKIQTFMATKAKFLNVSPKELTSLMNSSFIYVPFISSINEQTKENKITSTVNGGIIWWKVRNKKNGEIEIEQISKINTSSKCSIDKTDVDENGEPRYKRYKFGKSEWVTTPDQYAFYEAMYSFIKQLGNHTKKIDVFKRTAQIETKNEDLYGFRLGMREGIHIDDGLTAIEYIEDEKGNQKANTIAYFRVVKSNKNYTDNNNLSYAKLLLGPNQKIGSRVMLYPNSQFSIDLKYVNVSKMSLPLKNFQSFTTINEDLNSGQAIDFSLNYNLSTFIGISQLYATINTTYIYNKFDLNKSNSIYFDDPKSSLGQLGLYIGSTKKIFSGSNSLIGFLGIGGESLTINGEAYNLDYKIKIQSLGIKMALGYERLIAPGVSLSLGARYHLNVDPLSFLLTRENQEEIKLKAKDIKDLYPDLSLSTIGYTLGINYSLKKLPINLLSFLDKYKRY